MQRAPVTRLADVRVCILAIAAALLGVPASARAQGGPPLLTDDPDTPGPGYWEINVAMTVERSDGGREIEAPLADINYGVGDRIQLKFEVPWLSVISYGASLQTGPGNSLIGVKWRFLGEERRPIAWSVYPQLEMNTSRSMAGKGLVDEKRRLILPTEMTVEWRALELNVEVGRVIVDDEKGSWLSGVSTEIELPNGLELVSEVHSEKEASAAADVVVNVGLRHNLTQQVGLLASAGAVVRGASDRRGHPRAYLGFQFKLPREHGVARVAGP